MNALPRSTSLFDAHRPAVQFHQLLDQREADASAFVAAPTRSLHAVETVEDVRQLLRRDARRRCRARSIQPMSPASLNSTSISPSNVNLKAFEMQVEDDLLPHLAIDVDRLDRAAGNPR